MRISTASTEVGGMITLTNNKETPAINLFGALIITNTTLLALPLIYTNTIFFNEASAFSMTELTIQMAFFGLPLNE